MYFLYLFFKILDVTPPPKNGNTPPLKQGPCLGIGAKLVVGCQSCTCINWKWQCIQTCGTNKNPKSECKTGAFKYWGCYECDCVDSKWKCVKSLCGAHKRVPVKRIENTSAMCKVGELGIHGCRKCKCEEPGDWFCNQKTCKILPI